MNRLPALTAVFLVVTSFPLSADTHEAHVHGEAELSIVVDQTHLEILLSLPGMDFIGFEYEPVTDEERDLVHSRFESIEEDPESYFILKTGLFSQLEPMHIHVSESEHHHDEGEHDDVGDDNEKHHNEYVIELEYRSTREPGRDPSILKISSRSFPQLKLSTGF
jgi:hypothetical protein